MIADVVGEVFYSCTIMVRTPYTTLLRTLALPFSAFLHAQLTRVNCRLTSSHAAFADNSCTGCECLYICTPTSQSTQFLTAQSDASPNLVDLLPERAGPETMRGQGCAEVPSEQKWSSQLWRAQLAQQRSGRGGGDWLPLPSGQRTRRRRSRSTTERSFGARLTGLGLLCRHECCLRRLPQRNQWERGMATTPFFLS